MGFQHFKQMVQGAFHLQERLPRLTVTLHIGGGESITPVFLGKCLAQLLSAYLQIGQGQQQGGIISTHFGGFAFTITCQFLQLMIAETPAKKMGDHVRNFMGLIEDHDSMIGEQFAKAAVAQRQIGKKKVMVDHDHLCLACPFPNQGQKTELILGAAATWAMVATGADICPEGEIIGQIKQLFTVAGFGLIGPGDDLLAPAPFAMAADPSQVQKAGEAFAAEIVAPTFEQGCRKLASGYLAQQWNIFLKDLLLERFGGGGDDHRFAHGQQGQQIGEGFTGPGWGFNNQRFFCLHRFYYLLGHAALYGTGFISRNMACQRAFCAEQGVNPVAGVVHGV